MTRKRRVYVAGPISPREAGGKGAIEMLNNIGRGVRASEAVMHAGFAPFSPFLDFQYFICAERSPEELGDAVENIRAVSLEWLKVSDAMLLVQPYEHSKGTATEISVAIMYGIPVFGSLSDLVEYFHARDLGKIS